MKAYEEFKYWFIYKDRNRFDIVDRSTGTSVGYMDSSVPAGLDKENYSTDREAIMHDWRQFKLRPEYDLYVPYHLTYDHPQSEMIEVYENKLLGCAMVRAQRNGHDPEEVGDKMRKCLNWLRDTDFYKAPASTKYHDSQPCGLLKHSLDVCDRIIELSPLPSFEAVKLDNAILCALVHDWCKIGLYKEFMRNVKENGQWVQVIGYQWTNPKVPLGHGEASQYLASRFFHLSLEETLAIRWHMGPWNVSDDGKSYLQNADENYPLVLMLQFADQLATVKY